MHCRFLFLRYRHCHFEITFVFAPATTLVVCSSLGTLHTCARFSKADLHSFLIWHSKSPSLQLQLLVRFLVPQSSFPTLKIPTVVTSATHLLN